MKRKERKLLTFMANRFFEKEILDSVKVTLSNLLNRIEHYSEEDFPPGKQMLRNTMPIAIAEVEINLELLKLAYYQSADKEKEKIVKDVSKKFNL